MLRFFFAVFMFFSPSLFAESQMEWSGDIRLRGNQLKESVDEARTYSQLRVRLGLKANVNEKVKAIVRLATATSAISTNQTLGDSKSPGMARRTFGLDLAYADWKLHEFGRLWLGRTANPFWSPGKAQTIYDSDLAFEGVASKWEPQWSDSSAFVNMGAYIISENYVKPKDSVDVGLIAIDIGYKKTISNSALTVHLGNHHFLNIQNSLIGGIESGAELDPYSTPFERYRGNSVYAPDPLAPIDKRYFIKNKYTLFNSGFEFKTNWPNHIESNLYFEYVRNYAVGELTQAFESGASVKWFDLTFSFAHIIKDVDAVLATFTDSDSNGGGTDNSGFKIQANYAVAKNANVALTRIQAERGVHSVSRDFVWTQAELSVSF